MKLKKKEQLNFIKRFINMKKNIELCIRDKNGYIVGWKVGYSDTELKQLLKRHKDEGWHISCAEYTEEGIR